MSYICDCCGKIITHGTIEMYRSTYSIVDGRGTKIYETDGRILTFCSDCQKNKYMIKKICSEVDRHEPTHAEKYKLGVFQLPIEDIVQRGKSSDEHSVLKIPGEHS